MREDQEKQILQWVYATAQDEIQKVNHILGWLNNDKVYKIDDKMIELLSYQYELQRFLNKITIRMDLSSNKMIENITVSYDMKDRTEWMKYQIHENREAGIYAWEMAKELIDLQEDLMKKYQVPWQ